MRTITRVTAAALAAILTITPLVGAWGAYGTSEPDTSFDTAEWMWQDAASEVTKPRIYFAGWSAAQASSSANLAALGTSYPAPTMERPAAVLGVWIDCNGDGYIGLAESALDEYRSELLLDTGLCPAITGDDDNWTVGAHNYNGWVTELIPIAPDVASTINTKMYRAKDVRVWADAGKPGQDSTAAGGATCAVNPFPRGTVQSTGGALNYVDCLTAAMDRYNTVAAASNGVLPVFENDDDARGTFADVGTFGSDDSSNAAVTVTDCGEGAPLLATAPLVNGTGLNGPLQTTIDSVDDAAPGPALPDAYVLYSVTVPAIDPQMGDTQDPTAPGQVNQSLEERYVTTGPANVGGDCDTSNDGGNDFYGALNEGNQVNRPATGKNKPSWAFSYFGGGRGTADAASVLDNEGDAGTPSDLGVGATRTVLGQTWGGDSNLLRTPFVPIAARHGLNTESPTDSNPSVNASNGEWKTYYAFVSADITDLFTKTPGSSIYGQEQCDGATSGIHGGWECDKSKWNLDAQGNPLPGQQNFAAVYQPYNFRDVDCSDDRNALGISTATVLDNSDDPCV